MPIAFRACLAFALLTALVACKPSSPESATTTADNAPAATETAAGKVSAVAGALNPMTSPKEEIMASVDKFASLKSYRHLRGELVFCNMDGRMFRKNEVKHPLWRACRKAGLRQVGWHLLRQTFASHLAMRGASMRVIQELLGHSTIQMTMRYAHLAPEVARDAVRMLDNISRGSGVAAAIGSGAK